MENLIQPIVLDSLKKELTTSKLIKQTKNKNEIYIFSSKDSPNLLQELGRLRELTFRNAGGGTGKPVDLDEFDNFFQQLIVWNPQDEEIVGGYRFALMKDLFKDGKILSPTEELFDFSTKFIQEYLPYSIELGRSFIQPKYQNTLYSLFNLWNGLGHLVKENREIKYFFGKVTMYQKYNEQAKLLILYFLEKHFPDTEKLLKPKTEFEDKSLQESIHLLKGIFLKNSYREDKSILKTSLSKFNERIPPLISSYMDLSPTMKSFGTAFNKKFGNTIETGILITIKDIHEELMERYLS
ncbi:MAG: GNAT family N-acetyltransferase [Candidatus Absconditabacterales bacterium]|jgi:hypothetical protein